MQTTESPRRSPNPLDLLTRRAAAACIHLYQKQLSPYKGFSCAYRVLHRSESCSQYTKHLLSELGIGQALPLIQQRFQACKAANQTLKTNRCQVRELQEALRQPWMAIEDESLDEAPIEQPDENAHPQKERSQQPGQSIGGGSFRRPPLASTNHANHTTNQNTCSDWNCDTIDCASLGCDAIDCSSTDCSGMDCGAGDWQSFDCSGLDCGSCDVGSCDCSF
jgi:putative component of membrane protein insertase Oxa1/YidC/SpoIIIJ protein YidD